MGAVLNQNSVPMGHDYIGITELKPVGVLSELDADELRQLSSYGRVWDAEKGEVVIASGDKQDCLYLVCRGTLEVIRDTQRGREVMAELHVGDAFGEMNFLDHEQASATVLAASKANIWQLNRNDFDLLSDRHPHAAMKLFRALAVMVTGRLRNSVGLTGASSEEAAPPPRKRWW